MSPYSYALARFKAGEHPHMYVDGIADRFRIIGATGQTLGDQFYETRAEAAAVRQKAFDKALRCWSKA